jgi:hypothetical protein
MKKKNTKTLIIQIYKFIIMKKSVYKGSLKLQVSLIDWTPINEKISNIVGCKVECRIGNAFIDDIEATFNDVIQKQSIIVDKECCGKYSVSKYMYISELNNSEPFHVKLFSVEFYKVDENLFSLEPSFVFEIDKDDIKNCLTGETKCLYEYMGSRYRYNPRIESNEWRLLSLVYENGQNNWSIFEDRIKIND